MESPVSVAVQEAALLSMIRISADCDDIPDQVIGSVKGLKGLSRRHIRKVVPPPIYIVGFDVQRCA